MRPTADEGETALCGRLPQQLAELSKLGNCLRDARVHTRDELDRVRHVLGYNAGVINRRNDLRAEPRQFAARGIYDRKLPLDTER